MAASESTKFQVNFRAGNALINVYARDEGEVDAGLAWAREKSSEIAEVQGLLDAAAAVAAPGGGQPQAQRQAVPAQAQRPPAAQQQAPAGDGGNCGHGNRVFKDGNGKKGYWSAWMCPSRVQGCEPIWGN
jgi:hypothetical protein